MVTGSATTAESEQIMLRLRFAPRLLVRLDPQQAPREAGRPAVGRTGPRRHHKAGALQLTLTRLEAEPLPAPKERC